METRPDNRKRMMVMRGVTGGAVQIKEYLMRRTRKVEYFKFDDDCDNNQRTTTNTVCIVFARFVPINVIKPTGSEKEKNRGMLSKN